MYRKREQAREYIKFHRDSQTSPGRRIIMIYISSDWHLAKTPNGRRPHIDTATLNIVSEELKKLTKDDIFIFLGDLMDDGIRCPLSGEFERILLLRESILKTKKSIFIRGNNDDQSDNFYKVLGFDEIAYGVVANLEKDEKKINIILSHTSLDIHDSEWINIHGHIHRPNVDPDTISYYHDPSRCINICTADRRQLRLTALESIDLSKELERNNTWSLGFENPGMSTLCQNQAMLIFNRTNPENVKES